MKKILLVEDNEHIMRINAEYLSGRGYELEKAYSLRQAEEKIAKGEPDLIVLFTSTVSHKMLRSLEHETKGRNIKMARCARSSMAALKDVLDTHVGRA